MQKTIFLIDIGNVLCKFDPAHRLRMLAETSNLPAAEIDAQIWQSGFDAECDRGTYGFNRICMRLRQILGPHLLDAQLVELMTSAFWIDEAAFNGMQMLRGLGYTGTLSDNGPVVERGLERLCGDIFSALNFPPLYSHIFGATKKQAVLYSRVAERLGTQAGRITLIDDKPSNVETAQQAGLNAILFESWETLHQKLLHQAEPE